MAVIEIVTFRLAADVDERAFLEADHAAQTAFVYHRPGVVRRTTARGDDGQWLVVTLWASPGDAEDCAQAARQDPAVAILTACMDPSSVVSTRYDTLD